MGGGGEHASYPKSVWSPAGGWWADPVHWRRNTALAFLGIAAIAIPVFYKSAELEKRPVAPIRPIPSQRWSKNFAKPNPDALGGET